MTSAHSIGRQGLRVYNEDRTSVTAFVTCEVVSFIIVCGQWEPAGIVLVPTGHGEEGGTRPGYAARDDQVAVSAAPGPPVPS